MIADGEAGDDSKFAAPPSSQQEKLMMRFALVTVLTVVLSVFNMALPAHSGKAEGLAASMM